MFYLMQKTDFQLIFTIALKKELPKDYIESCGYPVATLKALNSGALNKLNNTSRGVLFIITGVGLEKSRKAAEFIKENISPIYVVNIGTVACLNKKGEIGSLITPTHVKDEAENLIQIDTRLPFPSPKYQIRNIDYGLMSIIKPQEIKNKENKNLYIDMEAFAQASVFKGSKTSFHILKVVTDYSDKNLKEDFLNNLNKAQNIIESCLSFLKAPKKPTISVVIPVFNREIKIKECIQSVLNQTLKPLEIIVVDDGSNDNTLQVLKSFEDKIRIIKNKENKGVSYSRNVGAKNSTGQWLAFLDSDDRWVPEKLENQWQYLQKNPFYEIFQSEEVWIRNGKRINACKHHQKPEGWVWEPCLKLCLISPSGVMLKKDLFEAVEGFDEALPACEDYDLWLRITRNKVVGLEPSFAIIKYGGHQDQLSQKYEAMDRFRVKALIKALENEQDQEFQAKIKPILKQKLDILILGCQKRGR